MAAPAAAASAKALIKKLILNAQSGAPREIQLRQLSISGKTRAAYGTLRSKSDKERIQRHKQKEKTELLVKRRTRSDREVDEEGFLKRYGNDSAAHVPVLLGEVLDVFASVRLKSFVDCTLGAGGHSAAVSEL